MKLSRLENIIRNKLKKRRLNPSADAWNKLEGELDGEKAIYEKPYWWMGIAAALLVGALIWVFTLSDHAGHSAKKSHAIAAQQPHQPKSKKPAPVIAQKSPDAHNPDSTRSQKAPKPAVKPSFIAKVQSNGKDASQKSTKPEGKAETKKETVSKTSNDSEIAASKNKAGNHKKYPVTDAEIDSLLHQAQLRIRAKSKLKENRNAISARALLREVEKSKHESIKEIIFENIQDGLQKVKSILASR